MLLCVIGPLNILFAGVHVCTFQPGKFTGWGSEGVNITGSAFFRSVTCSTRTASAGQTGCQFAQLSSSGSEYKINCSRQLTESCSNRD